MKGHLEGVRVDTEKEPTFHYWVELPEAEPVKFGELPGLMALAQHSDAFAQACAENNFEEALGKMVDAGTLQVRDPLTLGRHTFPIGDALRRAVLLPTEDVRPLLASFGIGLRLLPKGTGPTHWTIENAAAAIGAQRGFYGEAVRTLVRQMEREADDGALTVRHPHTGLPYRPDTVRVFYELVTPDDVNSWLDKKAAGYRWNPAGDAAPVVVPGPLPAVPSSKPDELPMWQALAKTMAHEIIKRERARDLYPSQETMANEIAVKFRSENPQIVGVGGKPLTGAYIKRHALKRISSAQSRQLSTATGRGKQGKN